MRSVLIINSFLAIVLCACDKESFTFQVGKDFVEPSTKVTVIDTLSVNLATYRMDSIVTCGLGKVIAGVFHDEWVGDIVARSYFQIGLPEIKEVGLDEECDSVFLVLSYNKYYIGDTIQEQGLEVFRLSEGLEDDNGGNIYNTTSFSHYPEPVGSLRFTPRPLKQDTLGIPLDKELGTELLEYLKNSSSSLTEGDFLKVFQGFVVSPLASESHSVLGFSASDSFLYLRVHSHEPGPFDVPAEHIFPMVNSSLQYNQISFDLAHVPELDTINEKRGIGKAYLENKAYIQGGLGLYTKVTFPTLQKITGQPELDNILLIKAWLYLDPSDYDPDRTGFVDTIQIYESEMNGDKGSSLLNESSAPLVSDFIVDQIYRDNTYYVFDVTSYMNQEIMDYYIEPDFGFYLDFSPNKAATMLDRIVLDGNQKDKNNQLRLELTFFQYDL